MTLHNIPEGVAVALPIYFVTKSKFKAVMLATVSGLAEPLAVVVAALFFPSSISQNAVDAMLGGVAGIMAFLALYELLPLVCTDDIIHSHLSFHRSQRCALMNFCLFLAVYEPRRGRHCHCLAICRYGSHVHHAGRDEGFVTGVPKHPVITRIYLYVYITRVGTIMAAVSHLLCRKLSISTYTSCNSANCNPSPM